MKKISLTLLSAAFLLGIGFAPTAVYAASLYIDPPFSDLYKGDSVKLSVRLDTDEAVGECVNAVDAVINYTEGIEPVDISIGGSIFSMWVESPTINREDRTITFAGGIPNGYCGRVTGDPRLTNVLVDIIFRSPGFSIAGGEERDSAVVSIATESAAYLNDGLGTRASINSTPATLRLFKVPGNEISKPWQEAVRNDNRPPQEFSISLQKDTSAFNQRYFISFNTTDKETGVDEYQVIEEPLSQFGAFEWGRADAPWIVARSPYVLNDQSLNSIIRVKAIDKAGNEYIATLIPDDSQKTISSSQITTIVIVLFALILLTILGVIALTFYRRFKKRKQKLVDKDDSEVEESEEGHEDEEDEEEYEDEDEEELDDYEK